MYRYTGAVPVYHSAKTSYRGLPVHWLWTTLNETGHRGSRDRKRGLVVYGTWVILTELGHGGSCDKKRGLDV